MALEMDGWQMAQIGAGVLATRWLAPQNTPKDNCR
jgi:hypothetical protein